MMQWPNDNNDNNGNNNWNALEKRYAPPRFRECPLTETERFPTPAPSLLLKSALWRGDTAAVRHAVLHQGANTLFVSRDAQRRAPFCTPLMIAVWLQPNDNRQGEQGHMKRRNDKHDDHDDDNDEGDNDDLVAFLMQCEARNHPVGIRPSLAREFAMACGETTNRHSRISLAKIQRLVQFFGQTLVTACPTTSTTSGTTWTPLHYACFQCDWPLIRYLVQHSGGGDNACWHARGAVHGLTPLHVLQFRAQQSQDFGQCLAHVLTTTTTTTTQQQQQQQQPALDTLLLESDQGITVLEHVLLDQADVETRNFCVAWLVRQTTR